MLGLDILEGLVGQAGQLSLPRLDDLPHGTEHHLVATLTPMIRAAERRESYHLVLTLAGALGRRGWKVDFLQQLLEPVTKAQPDSLAMHAIALWLAPPATRNARVERLLKSDPSVIAIPAVFEHLHRRRQDLLDPFLEGRAIKGKFLTGKTIYVPPATSGFHRWLPRQQRAFSRYLERVAADGSRSAWERVSALRRLVRLETTSAQDIIHWLADPDINLQEAALSALTWLDDVTDALPVLLEHLDSDRARVAMYAVTRVARLVDPAVFARTLLELLERPRLRVTVHKEVLRLLGQHRPPGALQALRIQWDRPDLHRDARIAVLHAVRRLLHEPQAWQFLEEAAATPDPFVALSLLEQRPADLPPAQRHPYAALMLRLATHADLRVRRQVYSVLGRWSSGLEEETAAAAVACVATLQDTPEWRTALAALLEITSDGAAQAHILDLARRLLAAPAAPDQEATRERDLPALQRLLELVRSISGWTLSTRLARAGTLRAMADLLAPMDLQAATLRLSTLDFTGPAEAARELSELAPAVDTHDLPEVLSCLCRVAQDRTGPADRGPLLEVAETLAMVAAPSARLMALALVSVAGPATAWTDRATSLLRALRRDASAQVCRAASRLFTAAE